MAEAAFRSSGSWLQVWAEFRDMLKAVRFIVDCSSCGSVWRIVSGLDDGAFD